MASCSVCDVDFNEIPSPEPRIHCKFCNSAVHVACAGMPMDLIEFFYTNKNYMWYCDNCIKAGNYNIEIMKRLQTLETIIAYQTEKISEQSSAIDQLKLMLNQSSVQKLQPNKRLFSDAARQWSEDCVTPRTINNFGTSDTVKKSAKRRKQDKSINEDRKGDPIIVVKPSNESEVNDIRREIKKIINPTRDPVKTMRESAKGSIIISCDDHSVVDTIQKKLSENLTDKFDCEVERQKQRKPVIKLVGINDYNGDENELLENIRKQNDMEDESYEIELMFVREVKLTRRSYHTAYIKTDKKTFDKIMCTGRLNILWDRVKCFENVNVLRCFKCSRFGHIIEKCTSEDFICGKCCGNHDTKDCKSADFKCINCATNNETLRMNLPTDHSALDSKCQSLQKRIERVTNKICYEQ